MFCNQKTTYSRNYRLKFGREFFLNPCQTQPDPRLQYSHTTNKMTSDDITIHKKYHKPFNILQLQ